MRTTLMILGLSLFLISAASANTCPAGKVKNYLGFCIEPNYIQGCHLYESQKTCRVCEFLYERAPNGLCWLSQGQKGDCCLQNGFAGCTKCQNGLYLIDKKCTESDILGCIQKNDQGRCVNCASDFFLRGGICKESIKSCVEFVDKERQVCDKCLVGYSLVNNMCVENQILGCKTQKDKKCSDCYRPFQLTKDHKCYIKQCKVFNDFGCNACECGFYITADRTCKPIQQGCIRHSRGQCVDCYQNYRLIGDRCVIEGCEKEGFMKCQKCQKDYFLVDGGCKFQNCLSWMNGYCLVCDHGFKPSAGKCTKENEIQTLE